MPDKPAAFIDTNIWLYAFLDTGDAKKSSHAKEVLSQTEPILSVQVINEICVNLIKNKSHSLSKRFTKNIPL
jgi:predicted nucleic acid-binding protein